MKYNEILQNVQNLIENNNLQSLEDKNFHEFSYMMEYPEYYKKVSDLFRYIINAIQDTLKNNNQNYNNKFGFAFHLVDQ